MRRALLTLAALVLVVTAGCSAPLDNDDLGKENGYRYDADVDVTFEDGLNDSELAAVSSRAMARIERIRGIEFTNTTPVEVISRAEFRNRSGGTGGDLSERQLWNEQVWEALFVVGEDETYPDSRSTNQGSTVLGYYSRSDDRIVIVSDTETPKVNRDTLVHELVHALQDQQLSFGTNPQFQDEQLAQRAVTEGDANYVEARYRQRCASEWSCISLPERTGGGDRPADFNEALFLTSIFPYTDGQRFVDERYRSGGWDAVDDLYDEFPESTEQVIHPERYPDDDPVSVSVPDRSRGEWGRFDVDPYYDVLGEASIYAMFQGNGQIGRSGVDRYDYAHPKSAGWAGDRLVPYRNGDRFGYVWRTEWESTGEAREFVRAYRDLLAGEGARSLGDNRYRIDDGPYADAFRVTRSGSTVTVVNGPRPATLDRIHPSN